MDSIVIFLSQQAFIYYANVEKQLQRIHYEREKIVKYCRQNMDKLQTTLLLIAIIKLLAFGEVLFDARVLGLFERLLFFISLAVVAFGFLIGNQSTRSAGQLRVQKHMPFILNLILFYSDTLVCLPRSRHIVALGLLYQECFKIMLEMHHQQTVRQRRKAFKVDLVPLCLLYAPFLLVHGPRLLCKMVLATVITKVIFWFLNSHKSTLLQDISKTIQEQRRKTVELKRSQKMLDVAAIQAVRAFQNQQQKLLSVENWNGGNSQIITQSAMSGRGQQDAYEISTTTFADAVKGEKANSLGVDALENYQSLKQCVNLLPTPMLLIQDSRQGFTANTALANLKLIKLLTGSDQANPLIIQELMDQKILKNLETNEFYSLKCLIQTSSTYLRAVSQSDEIQSLYRLNLPHLKEKCFIIKQESLRDRNAGELLAIFIFVEFTAIRNKIRETIAKDYRTLYYTSVAHDIKTPINGIMGTNQALLKTINHDRESRKLLITQNHCCKSLMYFSTSIQDLASLENGEFKIEKDFFQMRRSLNDVLIMLQEQIGNRGIKIQFYCDNNVPDLIYSDVRRIKQVLYQLVTNAIKYTQKGQIKVSVSITERLPIQSFEPQALMKQQSVIEEVGEEEEKDGNIAGESLMPINSLASRNPRRSLSLTQMPKDDLMQNKQLRLGNNKRNSIKGSLLNPAFRQTIRQTDLGDGGTGGIEVPIKFKLANNDNISPDRSFGSDESNLYSSENKSILINTDQLYPQAVNNVSRYLCLRVEDSGIGIKRKDLKTLFNLFSKTASDVHMSDHTGVGIGLTLCKKVCEELGGMIQLKSKVKSGSTFSCFFNISQPAENYEKSSSGSSSDVTSRISNSVMRTRDKRVGAVGADALGIHNMFRGNLGASKGSVRVSKASKNSNIENSIDNKSIGRPSMHINGTGSIAAHALGSQFQMGTCGQNQIKLNLAQTYQQRPTIIDKSKIRSNSSSISKSQQSPQKKTSFRIQRQKLAKDSSSSSSSGSSSSSSDSCSQSSRILCQQRQGNQLKQEEEEQKLPEEESKSRPLQGQEQIEFYEDNSLMEKTIKQIVPKESRCSHEVVPNEFNDTIGDEDKEIPDETGDQDSTMLFRYVQQKTMEVNSSRFKISILNPVPGNKISHHHSISQNMLLHSSNYYYQDNYLQMSRKFLNDPEGSMMQPHQKKSSMLVPRGKRSFFNHQPHQHSPSNISVKCGCTGSVLLIDDVQFNLTMAKLIFEQNYGILCDLANDGQEGFEKILKKSECKECRAYKLVLVDINMPVLNGIELMKKLMRANAERILNLSDSYYVAHTCLPLSSLGDFQKLGFDTYLDKPIKKKFVKKIIKKLEMI